jgi:hypothetical protein
VATRKIVERYFCEFGKSQRVPMHNGFIQTAEDWGRPANSIPDSDDLRQPRLWQHFDAFSSIVVIGAPRLGKSTCFEQYSKRTGSFFLPLKNVASPFSKAEFEASIEGGEVSWQKFLDSSGPGQLFIDSLDEGKIAAPTMLTNLVHWLKPIASRLKSSLRVHLSTRESDWARVDQTSWRELVAKSSSVDNPASCIELKLLPLRWQDIGEFCAAEGIDPQALLKKIPERDHHILAMPQTLQFFLKSFSVDGELPQARSALYDKVVTHALSEHNDSHRANPNSSATPVTKRAVAEDLALQTLLSDSEDIALDDALSNKCLKETLSSHTKNSLRETLSTSLFVTRKHEVWRFAEPEHVDYLAAQYLRKLICQEQLALDRALEFFFAGPSKQIVVPRLRGLACWLANLHDGFRNALIKRDQEVLLFGHDGVLEAKDKLEIWDALLRKYSHRDWLSGHEWDRHAVNLACDEICQRLGDAIKSNTTRYALKKLAIRVAYEGGLNQVVPAFIRLAEDKTENIALAVEAGYAIQILAPDHTKVFKTWLTWDEGTDPDRERLGCALQALWPQRMSAEEIVEHLLPQPRNHFGDYYRFLDSLVDTSGVEQHATLLNALAVEIEKHKTSRHVINRVDSHTYPSRIFGSLLLRHMVVRPASQRNDVDLERWLSTHHDAIKRGFVDDRGEAEQLARKIQADDSLRTSLAERRVARLREEFGASFEPKNITLCGFESLLIEGSDIPFWRQKILAGNDDQAIHGAHCRMYFLSLHKAGFPPSELEFVVEQHRKNATFRQTCESAVISNLPDNYSEQVTYNLNSQRQIAKRDLGEQRLVEAVRRNVDKLRAGNENLLVHVFTSPQRSPDGLGESVRKRFGDEVLSAFSDGLLAFWRASDDLSVEEGWTTNQIPWGATLVNQAVSNAAARGSIDWKTILAEQRLVALRAGLYSLNSLPEWYFDCLKLEEREAEALFLRLLEIEDDEKVEHPRLGLFLQRHCQCALFRQIALSYYDTIRPNNEKLANLIVECASADASSEVLDFLNLTAFEEFDLGNRERAFAILARVWKHRPAEVWDLVEKRFLAKGAQRENYFAQWVDALLEAHVFGLGWSDRWPDWVDTDVLLNMLDDFFVAFPPSSLVSINEINANDGVPPFRGSEEANALRDDILDKAIERGSARFPEIIERLIQKHADTFYEQKLLSKKERFHTLRDTEGWQPYKSNDLQRILFESVTPVRTVDEFQQLVTEIFTDVRSEIETGDSNLVSLLWAEENRPSKEDKVQTVVYDSIKKHSRWKKLVGCREPQISWAKSPDIAVTARLGGTQQAKAYVEVKRQTSSELISAIQKQLVARYLKDHDCVLGIYFVTWYGSQFWGPSVAELRAKFGMVPMSAHELQDALNRECASITVPRKNVRLLAIVIDASKPS